MKNKAEKNSRHLSPNMEDYLEAIAFLKQDKGVVRVKDISEALQVKRPSVTGALSILSKNGLVLHERYGYVELTDQGLRVAKQVLKRHDLLIKFLTGILGIDKEVARVDACKMEHSMSSVTFSKLTEFIESEERRLKSSEKSKG